MGQEDGKKWAAAAHSQPTFPKSDRLLGQRAQLLQPMFHGETLTASSPSGNPWAARLLKPIQPYMPRTLSGLIEGLGCIGTPFAWMRLPVHKKLEEQHDETGRS